MFTILVCDDEKDIVDAIEIYLAQEGYRVVAGINADFFDGNGTPTGILISGGELLSSDGGNNAVGFKADGSAIIDTPALALRGSLAETVGETLGVTGVTGTEVVKRNIIFTLVLTAAIVVFLVAGSSLKFLMI